jgi:hypothetical protein
MKRKHPLIPTEADIVKQITDWLSLNHIFWFYCPNKGVPDSSRDKVTPGAPDIVAVNAQGVMVAIEVKAPGGRQSKEQVGFQAKLEAAGGRYILARSIDDLCGYGWFSLALK